MSVTKKLLFIVMAFISTALFAADKVVPTPGGAGVKAEQQSNWLDTQTSVKWMNEGAYKKLESHLDDLYEEVKKQPENEYRLVWTYLAMTQYAENESAVKKWMQASPNSYHAKLVYGGVLHSKAADIRDGRVAKKISADEFGQMNKLYSEARQYLGSALKAKPDHAAAMYLYIGTCPSNEKCLPGDMDLVEKNAPHAYFARRAILNYLQPKWFGSIELITAYQNNLRKNLKNNSHWKPLLGYDQYAQCDIALRKEQYEEAMAYCRKAWSFGPDLSYLTSMAWLSAKVKQSNEFSGYVDEFRKTYPSNFYEKDFQKFAETMVKWGRSYTNKDPKEAIADYTTAQRTSPNYVVPYLERGKIYAGKNNFAAAEADYRKAVSLEPDDISHLEWLTYVMNQNKKAYEAIPLWQSYIQRYPNEGKAYYVMARAYYSKNDINAAYDNLKKSCALKYEEGCTWEAKMKTHPDLKK